MELDADESSDVLKKFKKDEIRMTKTMAMIVCSFVVCWLPIAVKFLIQIDSKFFFTLAITIASMNSAVDPLIFIFRMKEVGSGIKKLFECKLTNGSASAVSTTLSELSSEKV